MCPPLLQVCHRRIMPLKNPAWPDFYHRLLNTSAMAISAEIGGANGSEEAKTYGQAQADWFGP